MPVLQFFLLARALHFAPYPASDDPFSLREISSNAKSRFDPFS
jgi:hypothetical protein